MGKEAEGLERATWNCSGVGEEVEGERKADEMRRDCYVDSLFFRFSTVQ